MRSTPVLVLLAVIQVLLPQRFLHSADRKEEKPVCSAWQGIDHIETEDGFFTARVKLSVAGSTGTFYVESWKCLEKQVSQPSDCKTLLRHSKTVVNGSVSYEHARLRFAGASVESHQILFPAGATAENYCLDTLDGKPDGTRLDALHTDDCSPPTRIQFVKDKCD